MKVKMKNVFYFDYVDLRYEFVNERTAALIF